MQVYNNISGCPPTLVNDHRRVVREDEVEDATTKRQLKVVLCNDKIVIAEISGGTGQQTRRCSFLRWLKLKNLSVGDDSGLFEGNVIAITCTSGFALFTLLKHIGAVVDLIPPSQPDALPHPISLRFCGFDSIDRRNTFIKAIKSLIAEESNGGGKSQHVGFGASLKSYYGGWET